MKILIIVDYQKWAFDHIALAIQRLNADPSIIIDVQYINNTTWMKQSWYRYDVIHLMSWFLYDFVSFIPREKMISGVHSFTSYNRIPADSAKASSQLQQFKHINVVSKRIYNALSQNKNLSKIYYTPNGVDISLFQPDNFPSDFTISTVSSKNKWKLKRINELVIPTASQSNVKIIIASDFKNCRLSNNYFMLSHNQMPSFYNGSNCYVCASTDEGLSLSMLEAGACGRPIITTDVSGVEELIIDGETGFIVENNVDIIVDKINLLKNDKKLCERIGRNIREHIENNFSWEKVLPLWMNFILEK